MKVALLLLSSSLLAWYAPAQDEAKDLAKLEGTWQPTHVEIDGQPYKGDFSKDRLVIIGKNYTMTGPKVKMEGVLKIDSGKTPRQMDTEVTDGDGKGTRTVGIYELDGDRLMVCYRVAPGGRPTEFATGADSGRALIKYKRVK
jgi:uncharacterized protein (TIGR03067 family)